uniref:ATPase/GTPase, AAA15 family n=1 Tax=Candidatus Kentrum sp. MB TaxID=2138164 RepID=A0A451BBP4_9GAMM|nr:MAG: ATPase/GTPase, AAA15 family [Candidatus Kentron sp. MB]VFK33051.1 MAG: ATPase/GTPase, AAA15 family [Candidatus Kentron sp. MB]VFK75711.1 MAG: ATPase/GTPase, AAA15 family [Candidatus Kentron sp. MB]
MDALFERVRKSNYNTYLKWLRLRGVRGFSDAQVGFDFPVTALVGPNGGGKSTVLGAAACAYKDIKPSTFFPKSPLGDDSMSGWSIEYDLIDKTKNKTGTIRRSSRFRQLKWVRSDVVERPLSYFGISRTVPAGERPQLKKLMRPSYSHPSPLEGLPDQAAKEIEHILGKPVQDFRRTTIGENDTFHVGRNRGNEYSEFHFGAGESSIIRIVTDIERLPENSLILIEEIENGLHPVATRRLVEYLIAAAERKKIQAIFTTHSDDALSVLPHDAVWCCLDDSTQQGKLSIDALRAITGKVDMALAIFTEDDFAKRIVETVIREFLPGSFDRIEVHAVSGNSNAVRIHRNRLADPSAKHGSLCVIDGDSEQHDDESSGIFRLPGARPEAQVFHDVYAQISSNIALLTVHMQLASTKQTLVKRVMEEVDSTNRDPHVIFNQIGDKLDFIPEGIVKGAFISLWVRSREADFKPLCDRITREVTV